MPATIASRRRHTRWLQHFVRIRGPRESHLVALAQASAIGYDGFIASAPPPFGAEDGRELIDQAPAVVERYFPRYRQVYGRLGWSMSPSIDQIDDPGKAARRLGFVCRTGFAERLAALEQEPNRASAP